ncbi:hypothetical protein C8A03DRAFT_39359, partial [Achaetomium macrosporum]
MPEETDKSETRRKLRRGTSSCHECRRRKLKQSFDYDASTTSRYREVRRRLVRLEALVDQLLQQPAAASVRARADAFVGGQSRQPGAAETYNAGSSVPAANGFLMDDAATSTNHPSASEESAPHLGLIPSLVANLLVLARKLVELAIYLQQLGPDGSAVVTTGTLTTPPRAAAAYFVDAASRYVTSRTDNPLCCADGIELLMLEGVYHVNAGDWRRGWQTFRRALRIACALGLGRPLDGQGGCKADKRAWFRLVHSDRYMSLILGVPAAVPDDSSLSTMDGTELRRLERVHAVVTGRIAARNERLHHAGFWDGVPDEQEADNAYRETLQIDDDMKQAVRLLSAELWVLPAPAVDSTPAPATPVQIKETTARLFAQLKHFNLLVLLHFPYLMHSLDYRKSPSPSSWPGKWQGSGSYSMLTAVHASREVLSRFLVYRALRHVPLFYRGFDFMAVTASVVLLLAHLDGHRRGHGNILAHQRPGHLQMVGCAAPCFEAMDAQRTDPVSRSAAQVLRTLAAAESDAAQGLHEYLLWREDGPVGEVGCAVSEEQGGLRLTVPHFGIIHIVRKDTMAGSEMPGMQGWKYQQPRIH